MPLAPPEYLIDTSVAVKWVVSKAGADVLQARRLLSAYHRGDCTLSAPELIYVEFANALTAGHRKEVREVEEAIGFLRDLAMRAAPSHRSILDRAVNLAASKRVTVYDSYFLAAAEHSGITLVTANDTFLRRIGPHPYAMALRDVRLAK